MREPTVASVMTRDVVTVSPTTDFATIVDVLSANRISAVPVVNGDGRPIGVVSEADLLHKQANRGEPVQVPLLAGRRTRQRLHKATAVLARDLMTTPVRTITAGQVLSEAARELARGEVRRLFVVDGTRLVGILARRDLLRVFLRGDDEIREEITREVFERTLWADPATFTVSVRKGVATLSGQLDRRTETDIAAGLVAAVPGVVKVRNDLAWIWDDQTSRQHM